MGKTQSVDLNVSTHAAEVESGKRFRFGHNWKQYLSVLDEKRIQTAEKSVATIFGTQNLSGKRFVDIGCGSGLFSLAARRLGALVRSFDYDPDSVECAHELKNRFFRDDPDWVISQGSILDRTFVSSLGTFDFVYSWGVLHHTGHMWEAIENATSLVANGGTFAISIYNDQAGNSRRWKRIKAWYNRSPAPIKGIILLICFVYIWVPTMVIEILRATPFHTWRQHRKDRGMSPWHDLVDWVGGYPFEVAKPEEIFDFFHKRDFKLERMKTCGGGKGCNEFVFKHVSST